MKLTLFVISVISLFILPVSPALAVTQFSTMYDISYTVSPNGETLVSYDISQVNNLSSVYATQFSLSISQTNLSKIIATEDNLTITPEVVRTDNLTNISFKFNQKVVGKDKLHRFGISYISKDIATKVGSIWEINIPHLAGGEGVSQVNTTLIVPANFPEPAFINPAPIKQAGNVYHFNSTNTANQSISAVFGRLQYFHFNLFYNLSNDTSTKSTTTITLPPDTNYQKVYFQSIEPKPTAIDIDPDGNWIATIILPPKSDIQVKAEGIVRIGLTPGKVNLQNRDLYLQATNLWPIDDPLIKQTASKLTGAESIYQYVSDLLLYDYSRLSGESTRKGALGALQKPANAICTEFTDLFIALARAKGIPARELEGYAFTQNERLRPLSLSQDILHAWPEYYDDKLGAWIQIDPTWAKTTEGVDYFHKLDLNHFVFAIHGLSSVSPLPAGSYKTTTSNSRDIYIEPTSEITLPKAITEVKIISSNTKNINLLVENQSGVSFSGSLTATDPKMSLAQSYNINLPPYGSDLLDIPLRSRFSLVDRNSTINISINGQDYQQSITYTSPYRQNFFIALGFVLVGGSALISWRLRLRRRRVSPPVHW